MNYYLILITLGIFFLIHFLFKSLKFIFKILITLIILFIIYYFLKLAYL